MYSSIFFIALSVAAIHLHGWSEEGSKDQNIGVQCRADRTGNSRNISKLMYAHDSSLRAESKESLCKQIRCPPVAETC